MDLPKKNRRGFKNPEGFLYFLFDGLFKRLFHLIREILSGCPIEASWD